MQTQGIAHKPYRVTRLLLYAAAGALPLWWVFRRR